MLFGEFWEREGSNSKDQKKGGSLGEGEEGLPHVVSDFHIADDALWLHALLS